VEPSQRPCQFRTLSKLQVKAAFNAKTVLIMSCCFCCICCWPSAVDWHWKQSLTGI